MVRLWKTIADCLPRWLCQCAFPPALSEEFLLLRLFTSIWCCQSGCYPLQQLCHALLYNLRNRKCVFTTFCSSHYLRLCSWLYKTIALLLWLPALDLSRVQFSPFPQQACGQPCWSRQFTALPQSSSIPAFASLVPSVSPKPRFLSLRTEPCR